MDHVVEVVLFRLNDGVDEQAFLDAAQKTFDLLKGYDGYLNRTLTMNEDGLWIDIVNWRDISTAMNAAENIMSSKSGQAFGALIDPNSIQMYHVEPKIVDQVPAI